MPDLIDMLSDEDPRTRRDALLALARIGRANGESLEAVRARLDDEDATVRAYALTAFTQVCTNQGELDATAARLLADSDVDVRDSAHHLLVKRGPDAVPIALDL